ncbi:hypothetical protein [Acidiphilium sp.]|uniref:hypothetical protein n=1 Tax=Acidiphilium sp. TaxID=527 RepID=UPI002590AFA4|nr:hypothetical protein [Acidiphilium sp.]
MTRRPSAPPSDSHLLHTLSELSWNRFHTTAVLLFGLGWALDAFEVTLIGNVLGALRQHFGLGSNAMSVILAAWFVGLMIGAAGFGALSDPGSRSWGMREERSAVCRWIFDADLGRVPKRRPVCASAQ